MRDLDRSLSDRHEAVGGQHGQDLGDALVALDVELGQLDSSAYRRSPSPSSRQPQQDPPRDLACAGSSRAYAFSASRAIAPCTPPVCSYALMRSRRPSRRCQSSTSEVESSGSRARLPLDVRYQRVDHVRSTVKPARRAGSSIARRSSSRRIGPTST